jgi:hypothetical protein
LLAVTHVGWIGNYNVISLAEFFRLLEGAENAVVGVPKEELAVRVFGLDGLANGGNARLVETGLNKRAECGGLLKLMKESNHRLVEGLAQACSRRIIAKFALIEVDIVQCQDMRLNEIAGLNEPAGFFSGLKHDSQIGKLGGTGAYFKTVQIVLQDERGNLVGDMAILLINKEEKIESVRQHVPASARRIK